MNDRISNLEPVYTTLGEIPFNVYYIHQICYIIYPIINDHLVRYFDENLQHIRYQVVELMDIREKDKTVHFINRVISIKNSLNLCETLSELSEMDYDILQDNFNTLFDMAIEYGATYFYFSIV